MRETTTLYKKVGRRYVKHDDYLDERGLPEGLYLFYQNNHKGEHTSMKNMLHYAKVHDIQNIEKFSDIWVAYGEDIIKAISDEYDKWIKENKVFSINELATMVCKVLSKK